MKLLEYKATRAILISGTGVSVDIKSGVVKKKNKLIPVSTRAKQVIMAHEAVRPSHYVADFRMERGDIAKLVRQINFTVDDNVLKPDVSTNTIGFYLHQLRKAKILPKK